MNNLFPLIPVKLLFIGLTIYIWKQLLQRGRELNQPAISRYMLAFAVLSIVLSVISMGKIYPYGALTDLLIFAVATTLVMALPTRKLPVRILAALLIALPLSGPLIYLLHYQVVGGAMNKDSFIAVFQTTSAEASEYLASFTSVISVIPLILAAVLVIWIVQKNADTERRTLPLKPALLLTAAAVIMLIVTPLERGLFTFPADVYALYKEELVKAKERRTLFSQRNTEEYQASKQEKGEVYIVVVGESLNKHHMGIYGYDLDTTPNFSKLQSEGNLFVALNSFANYPGTMAALSQALTAANQKNNKAYTDSAGIVELLNQAGFTTHWIGNQPLSNSYDMILGLIAKEAQDVQLTFDTQFHSMSDRNQQPDGVLLPLVKATLAKRNPEKNQVIFVHLMGNHTDYCKRYPEEFNRYTVPALQTAWEYVFKGGLGHSRECYDNSVLYNDFVVTSMISELKSSLGESGIGGLLYFSDHSDDIERGVGHSSANYSVDMVESPAVVWLSPAYQQHNPEKMRSLRQNINQFYPNDFIFDTVIGMTGTRTEGPVYCAECDLFNPDYRLPLSEARTVHGKLAYQPLKNYQEQTKLAEAGQKEDSFTVQ